MERHAWQQEEERKEDSSIVLMLQEQLYISEPFKEHSGRYLFFLHYKTMLLFRATSSSIFTILDVRSICILIINSGLIPGGQSSSKRQTVFFLPVDPIDNSHKDPDVIGLGVPRHAQYLHNAWKRHQDAIYWVDINLAMKKD